MSIVDISKRSTNNWDEMHTCMCSPDSKIYIDNCGSMHPSSLDLQVGDTYIIPGSNRRYAIPKQGGLKVRPGRTVVVFVKQRIKLPLNVFGVVTGKGSYIFRGCFLSTGKIDPGFDGHLKIGFYNGGDTSIRLEQGSAFATAFFVNTETTLSAPLDVYSTELSPDIPVIKWYQRLWSYVKEHWIGFIAWTVVAVPTAILTIMQIIERLSDGNH